MYKAKERFSEDELKLVEKLFLYLEKKQHNAKNRMKARGLLNSLSCEELFYLIGKF